MNPVLTACQTSHTLAVCHRLDERRDQQWRVGTEDMGPKEGARRRVAVELADAVVVLNGPAVGHVALVLRRLHVLSTSEVLGASADRCHLWAREHRLGDPVMGQRTKGIGMHQVVCDGASFRVGHMFELEGRAAVSERPDAGGSPSEFIHHDAPVVVQRDPR